MATLCPKCGSPLKGEFGMVKCDACGDLVFIGVNGETSSGKPPPPTTDPIPGWDVPQNETQADVPDFAVPGELNEDVSQILTSWNEEEIKPVPSNSSDLSDIAAYGNSEISQGKDGFIVYDLIISGMETKDLRIAVRDALTDKKFMWDADNLIRGTKDGVLKLNRINPVKASLVVRRLKHLPVQVTWEQHVIVEGDPT